MKLFLKYSFLSLLLLIFFSSRAQDSTKVGKEVFIKSLDTYPSFEKVTRWFFSQYKHTDDNRNIRFAKDPRGWYVYESNPAEQGYIYNKQQVWSLKKQSYRKVNYRPIEDKKKAQENYKDFMQRQQARFYKIHPFYGYTGWDRDVIHNLKDYNNLPDSLIYGLARAYSNFALSSIRHQYTYSVSEHKPAGYEKISSQRLNMYETNMDSAFAEYQKLIKSNPDFKTVVGPIRVKYNNELMSAWHNLLSVKEPDRAQKYIEQVNYSEPVLSMAGNYLKSTHKNGILFTNGDNDTYPVWYLQEKRNFREDVLVINTSLLQSGWYTAMLRNKTQETRKENLISFTEEDFENSKRENIYNIQKKRSGKSMNLKNVISFLRNDENIYEPSSSREIFYMPTLKFKLPVMKGKLINKNYIAQHYKNHLENILSWNLSRSYFSRSEILVMDILSNNEWRFPVHFAISGDPRLFLGLDDYMKQEGFSYHFIPAQPTEKFKSSLAGYVNAPLSYKLFTKDFSYEGFDTKKVDSQIPGLFPRIIRMYSVSSASVLMGRNEKDSAKKLLKLIDKKISSDFYPYGLYSLSHAELFLQLEENEKAKKIIQAVANRQMNKLKELNSVPANSTDIKHIQYRIKRNKNILQNIIRLCKTYELKKAEKKYSDFLKQMEH